MRNNTKQRIVLCIMDGWGINKNSNHNAVALAKTPNVDYLTNTYPYSTLEASGEHVGLPKGQVGNSEVGHMNLGSGRVVIQTNNAANYEGRFEPELFGVMAAQARVGKARMKSDGPRGERVCVMCGASKCFACGACGLSAYCGAVCQKRDYGAHYVVCKAARKGV